MNKSLVGPVVTLLIVAGVALVLVLNREPGGTTVPAGVTGGDKAKPDGAQAPPTPRTMSVREYPIGDPVVKNHCEIAAVWLPSVGMAGMPELSTDLIHVEADIRATADNPNGFAKDEFVPYLKIRYELTDATSGKPLGSGDLIPMIAADGLHYGANIPKPAVGAYRLSYKVEPPSAGGLGRHSDPATGVAPWWAPFEVAFDWTMDGTEGQAVASIPAPGR